MDFRFNRVCISVLVLMVTSAVLSEDVKNETAEVKDDILKDCAAENSIREMLAKLEYELARRSFCSTEEEDRKLCFKGQGKNIMLMRLSSC